MLNGLIESFFHTAPLAPALKHMLQVPAQAFARLPIGGIVNLCLTGLFIAGSGFLSLLTVAGIFDVASWRDIRHVRNTLLCALGAAGSIAALFICQALLPAIPLGHI
jgi:hypothetical protein